MILVVESRETSAATPFWSYSLSHNDDATRPRRPSFDRQNCITPSRASSWENDYRCSDDTLIVRGDSLYAEFDNIYQIIQQTTADGVGSRTCSGRSIKHTFFLEQHLLS